jgi:CheY-like chemotaxis protein
VESRNLLRKVNVLAVDDLPANLLSIKAVLNGEYNVITAASGAEAISILLTRKDIDVILMDLQMPEMDGFEAATEIKKLPDCYDIPIIFVTAIYKEEPFVKRGYEVGGVDYFSKPFDPDILKKKIAIYSSFRLKNAVLKERERQIVETEELLLAGRKLSSVLENLPVGVLIADVDGRICQINETVSQILVSVHPAESDAYGEILGWWDSSGKMLKEENGPLSRALQNQETSHSETIAIQCFDGSKKTILCSAAPLFGLDQNIVGAVVIIQDVTESKKIEEDLEQRITKLVTLGVELEQSTSH